jgi:hypothetical protein
LRAVLNEAFISVAREQMWNYSNCRPERRAIFDDIRIPNAFSHCSVYSLFARDKHRSETNPGPGLLSQPGRNIARRARDLTRVRELRAYDEKPGLTNGDVTDAQDTHS